MSTAEYLTKRAGTGTIALENKRVDRSIMNVGAPEKYRCLILWENAALCRRQNLSSWLHKANLFWFRLAPDIVVLDKFPYTDLVDPSTLEFVNMKEHTPAWAQQAKNYHMPQPKADVQTTYTSHSQTSMSKPEGKTKKKTYSMRKMRFQLLLYLPNRSRPDPLPLKSRHALLRNRRQVKQNKRKCKSNSLAARM